mmetsp:Transcript_30734/g.53827  ORF Transcript_30734/g.53827 Transcript_30734/m.53827 type:complete len:145 (+) Transcript_30734:29-463(+)
MDKPRKRQKVSEVHEEFLSPIADPLAEPKLAKSLVKLAGKFSEAKMTRRGVKEVVKSLRKGKRGIVILAGDITPVELVAHIPILCEKQSIPYIYVKSKDELSGAALSKNPTTVVMLARPQSGSEFRDIYKKYYEKVKAANPYLV